MQISGIRGRWAAIGAAVAVTLGAGGIGITHATTSSGERAIYAPLDEPCRLADNRPDGIGPETSVTFSGWGMVGDCDLPADTSALALNVTAVDATQQTNLRFYPAGTDVPETANLNPTPGAPPIPNAVNVALSDTGEFSVFNKFGTVAVVIDVMGVYDDHDHDDRYYTKDEIDSSVANSIIAMGHVSEGAISPDWPSVGNVVVTNSPVGSFNLLFPGLRPGCVGDWPLIILTGEMGSVARAAGGSTSDCTSGDTNWSIVVSNLDGTPTNLPFNFVAYHQGAPSLTELPEGALRSGTCTLDIATGTEACG